MKLNLKQKRFLFDNNYVNAKVLDASTEPGWQDYFTKYFDWELAGKDRYGFERLYLIDNGKSKYGSKGDIEYTIGLNFQNNDKELLARL